MRFSPKPTWRRSSAIVPESVWANFGFTSWFMACIISKTLNAMPSRTMFWPTTPATKSLRSTFSSSTSANLHQVRVGVLLDGVLESGLRDAEVVEALGEDLDVTGLVEGLGGEEALAPLVGRRVDQAGRRRQRATLADHQLHGRADRLLPQDWDCS